MLTVGDITAMTEKVTAARDALVLASIVETSIFVNQLDLPEDFIKGCGHFQLHFPRRKAVWYIMTLRAMHWMMQDFLHC